MCTLSLEKTWGTVSLENMVCSFDSVTTDYGVHIVVRAHGVHSVFGEHGVHMCAQCL